MAGIFVDTSGWGHLLDRTQEHHALAAAIYRAAKKRGDTILTSNYVLTELAALLISPLRLARPTTIRLIEEIRASPFIQIIHIDPTLDEQAWQLFKNYQDKAWSLVDCASFVIMKQNHISEALTSDYHFEQAGFGRLLGPRVG